MHQKKVDTAGLPLPPPFVVLGFLIAGLIVSVIFPINLLPLIALRLILGAVLVATGLFIASRAIRLMTLVHTPVDPFEPTSAIVTSGPYRFSRNPIYLGLALAYLGIALALNATWAVVLWPLMLIAMTYVIVVREEKYLEAKFGEVYVQYKSKVRRWI